MPEKIIGLHNAAKVADVSYVTIRDWCLNYGIGEKVGNQWQIDADKLDNLIKARKHLQLLRAL